MKKLLRQLVESSLSRAGYELVPSYLMHNIALRNHLRDLFNHFRISCVLDVGAHYGEFARFLRRGVGYKGRIISFEPVVEHFNLLSQRALDDPLWDPVRLALGRNTAIKPIHVTRGSSFTSFRLRDLDSMEMFATDRQKQATELDHSEAVEIEPLDSVLPELLSIGERMNVYLKLDTQGFDLEVLSGATESLRCISALQTEIAMQRIYEGAPDFYTSISEFQKHGFQVAGFFSLARAKNFSAIEFDCTMVRTNKKPIKLHPITPP